MSEDPAKPIVSTRFDDPDCEEQIQAFVVRLGERIDTIQDAALAEDRETLRQLARSLAGEAENLGYPPLLAAARHAEVACSEPGPEALHKAVAQLTELSQRIRRGHRSAAG